MRIGIVYGHISGNLGDVSINYGTAAMLQKIAPDAHVHVVLLNLPEDRRPVAEAAFKDIKSISFSILRTREEIGAGISNDYSELALATEYVLDPARFIADAGLTGCDLLLYNSGEQIFTYQDRGNPISLIWRVLPALAAKTAGMRFVILPSTFGPFEMASLAPMLRAFFALSDAFAVRENRSAELVAEFLGGPAPRVLLDPSFFMSAPQQPIYGNEATLGMVMRLETWGLRAVKKMSFRAFVEHMAQYREKGFGNSVSFRSALAAVRSFLDGVSESKVNLIIENRPSDVDLTLAVAEALAEQGYDDRVKVVQPASVSEYQQELANVSFIVSSRLHGCILGLLAGKPVMGIYFDEHGHKMPGLFSMLDVSDYCHKVSRTSPEAIVESIVPLFLERERAFAGMPERLHTMQAETLEWLKQALASKPVVSRDEIATALPAYISGVEAIRMQALPDMVPVLYRGAIRLKADLNTTKADLDITKKEVSRLQAELGAVRSSFSFQLGSMLVQAVRKPGRSTILLPYRVLRLGIRAVSGRPLSPIPRAAANKAYVLGTVKERINAIRQQMESASTYIVEPQRKDSKIAVIMDKFTYDCFRYEANLITFTPRDWKEVLSKNRPHFLLVESAWQGNDASWGSQIVNLGQRPDNRLPELVEWCKSQSIPTAFWNKEDPAHYEEFLDAARLFDYVFTTDANSVEKYKKDLGQNNVFCLPFAIQPKIHNPIGSSQKIRDIAFAGSWYEGESEYRKHRKEQISNILEPALDYGVDIFDRHYTLNNDRYRFPEQCQPYIVGELPYDDMVYAYKMYRIFLNVNSVIDSPTMFPRRVLEILASGTCVLSGYAKGIENLIGSNIVKISSSPEETRLYLRQLLENKEQRDRLAQLGMRRIMREHTYEKRLAFVLQTMGIGYGNGDEKRKGVSIITCTNKPGYMENIFANYRRQQYEDKELIIVLNNDRLDLGEWQDEAQKHMKVRVFQVSENEPLGTCLNFATDKAALNYIAKFDDDDYYAPSYLGDLMLAFTYSGAHIVGKGAHYVYFERTGTMALRNPGNEHQYTQWVAGGTMLVRREVFDQVKFSCRQPGTDSQFLKDCHEKGFRIYSADRFNFVHIRKSTPDLHTWKDEERLLAVSKPLVYDIHDYRLFCSDQYEVTVHTERNNYIRIALYADANMNLIDGSSVWTASLVEALAGLERVKVFFFLKSKEKRGLLTEPLKKFGNVEIISPNEDLGKGSLTPDMALDEIEDMDRRFNFDTIVLRGFSLCEKVSLRTRLHGRLWTYLTDIPQKSEDLTESVLQMLDKIAGASKYILCQTEEFCSYWERQIASARGKVRLLPPMVPACNRRSETPTTIRRICYAGKFAPLWGIFEMFKVFTSLREVRPEVELHIFGDKIHNPPDLHDFQSTVQSYLEDTAGVVWHRGLGREDVLRHMVTMDLGWAWRNPELENNTLELSTKILEYGRCGLPVVLARNNVNEKLLGPDYPLFANTYDEGVNLMHRLISSPDLLAAASAKTYSASEQFTVEKVRDKYVRPLLGDSSVPGALSKTTKHGAMLVNGHDLKFIDGLCRKFSEQGYAVTIDNWEGHNIHNIGKSRKLVKKADIIISEWCLGNAVWYSKNKLPCQKHIIRFHLQERDLKYPKRVDMQNVNAVIFVGPHIRREAIDRFGWERWADKKLVVIPNYVDTEALDLPKPADAQFKIGIVGIVPERKRLDLALDIIAKLRQEDQRFHLYVKGKLPEEYPWMSNRTKGLQYYERQMNRIKNSDLLKDAVHFDGWGDDMPQWYQKIGFILSVSDFESFHLSIPEGAASGAIPLSLKWEGAEEIYPEDWSYYTVGEIANAILDIVQSGRFEEIAESRCAYVKKNFDIEHIARLWLEVIEGDHGSID